MNSATADRKTGLALSIRQPWAWLIVAGHKPVENRTWRTDVRGWIGIHASQTLDSEHHRWIARTYPELALPAPDELPLGGIIGRARLVDCVTAMESEWFSGPYGFLLANAEPLPFQPCRGRLGFFRPEPLDAWKQTEGAT